MNTARQTVGGSSRFPSANRAFFPKGYDLWWAQGRRAAEEDASRDQPFLFAYSYEAGCWFDGYDNVHQKGD